jgi:muconolactone delta-isomerase
VVTGPPPSEAVEATVVEHESVREALAMQYLVTMTTRVPDGTPDESVQAVRGREAAHSRELAAQGHLLRLWRPPLLPGEWRTIGLFAAEDAAQLEDILASMPLHIWRTDEVEALSPHPNDPPSTTQPNTAPEFLTRFTVSFPPGVPERQIDEARAGEAERTRELADEGHLARLWMLPSLEADSWRALGLWRARDGAEMRAVVDSLPLSQWMTTDITPLTEHPSDPGAAAI